MHLAETDVCDRKARVLVSGKGDNPVVQYQKGLRLFHLHSGEDTTVQRIRLEITVELEGDVEVVVTLESVDPNAP